MTMIERSLSPARVNEILPDEDSRMVTAVVDDDQLSLAIGREGKNVRLAAKLTGWKIDLVSASEHYLRQRLAEELSLAIAEMPGVDEATAAQLTSAGIETVDQMAVVTEEQLELLAGMDPEKAGELIATAQATLEELRKQVEEMIEREKAEGSSDPFLAKEFFGEGGEEKKLEEADVFGAGTSKPAKKDDVPKLTEEDIFGEEKD